MKSKHIFLFPFTWDEHKTLDSFFDSDNNWNRKAFNVVDSGTFNEKVYFYDFVREAMHDSGGKDDLVKHYEYELGENPTYSISIKEEEEDKDKDKEVKNPIVLKVKGIFLNLYTTGVGVLSFHLENNRLEQDGFDTILKINEFGRRIYPQFLGGKGIKDTFGTFLAEKITLDTGKNTIITDGLEEAYPNYPNDIILSKVILDIFPKDVQKTIQPIIDDRMFVICWYGNDRMISDLANFNSDTKQYTYSTSDDWYRFLFVDAGQPTVQNQLMQKDLLQKHSYARWIDGSQLFGISRYSFMVMTKYDGWLIPDHISSVYYKMIELTIVQRTSALKFSQKATNISKLEGSAKDISTKVSSLFKNYIEFQNRIYFREVTAQEQGIELYDMMQHHMRTEREIKELDQEIDELNQYANLIEAKEQTKAANRFALIATVFLPASLIAGILGMNTTPDGNGNIILEYPHFWWTVLILFVLSIIFYQLHKEKKGWTKK